MEGLGEEITVLVCLETENGSRNREVTFKGHKNELVQGIEKEFSDILCARGEQLIVQIRDETWGQGMFVDLIKQHIPNRAVIKAIQVVNKHHEVGVAHYQCIYKLSEQEGLFDVPNASYKYMAGRGLD